MAGIVGTFLSDGGQCAVRFSGGSDEWHLYERVCAERQAGPLYPDDDQYLSGIPSIVFGLFGMALFVKYMGFGDSILAGS